MKRSRTLSPIDLLIYKKPFFWDKNYFGLVGNSELISYILFSKYGKSKYVSEILSLEHPCDELLKDFIDKYSKKGIRYFMAELDENTESGNIEFMRSQGFKRFNRNYYFKYQESSESIGNIEVDDKSINLICKAADEEHLEQIIDIEISSQLLEYRDHLYKSKKYFQEKLSFTYVFLDSKNPEKVYGFACKKGDEFSDIFDITSFHNLSNIIPACIESLADYYIKFEKNPELIFIINENHQNNLKSLENRHKLISSKQLLLRESTQKKKIPSLASIFQTNKIGARSSVSSVSVAESKVREAK